MGLHQILLRISPGFVGQPENWWKTRKLLSLTYMIDAHQNISNYIDSIQTIQMIYLSPHSLVRGGCSHVWLRRYVLMNNSINFWLCKIVDIIYHLFNITVLLMSRPGYPTHYGLFFIPLWSPVCFYRMFSEKKPFLNLPTSIEDILIIY